MARQGWQAGLCRQTVTPQGHGKEATLAARRISQSLFSEDVQSLTEDDFGQLALDGLPHVKQSRAVADLIGTLVKTELATSKSQARSFIESGAISINGNKVTDLYYEFREKDIRFGRYTMTYVGGSRFLLRALLRQVSLVHCQRIPVAIYGVGSAGLELMMTLHSSHQLRVVALFDDNANLWGSRYGGMIVYNPAQLAAVMQLHKSRELLLAMPSVSRSRHRDILQLLEPLCLTIRRVPHLSTLVSGELRVDELKPVDIDDLLGRDQIPPKPELLRRNIQGRVVMKIFTRLQQCLGWNTPHVKAGPTQRRFPIQSLERIDTSGIKPQLCSADRGDIATRPPTNHNYIKLLTH